MVALYSDQKAIDILLMSVLGTSCVPGCFFLSQKRKRSKHPDENMEQYVLHCQTCWKYPLVGEFTWQFIQLLSWQEERNGDVSKWLKKIQSSFT